MERIAGLTREYVQIIREKSGSVTYGGNQGFFAASPAGSIDERKNRMGCGIIAFCDLLLYLAGGDPVYRLEENESYVNRSVREQEYKAYFNQMYDFLGGLPEKTGNGLSGMRLWRKFNCMAKLKGWNLRAKWGVNGRKLYGRMTEMLRRDIPVILCVPLMLFKKDKDQGITFYKKENNRYCRECTVSAHYVVVTEILKDNGSIYLAIASWGVKYYINWSEYDKLIHTHFLGTILGNILYIDFRGQ